jgi:hypothetical protein
MTIQSAKRGKAVGIDQKRVELMKYVPLKMKKLLLKILNRMYKIAEIPEDLIFSTFIPIPKKSNLRKCSDHRTKL